jgi:hypothetical protein
MYFVITRLERPERNVKRGHSVPQARSCRLPSLRSQVRSWTKWNWDRVFLTNVVSLLIILPRDSAHSLFILSLILYVVWILAGLLNISLKNTQWTDRDSNRIHSYRVTATLFCFVTICIVSKVCSIRISCAVNEQIEEACKIANITIGTCVHLNVIPSHHRTGERRICWCASHMIIITSRMCPWCGNWITGVLISSIAVSWASCYSAVVLDTESRSQGA